MSREAQLWCSQLPLDVGVNLAAFRVLDKLADAHHHDTGYAFRNVDGMALELGCSIRTVQRALRDLEVFGLIQRGDQAVLGTSFAVNRRPTVYRLPLDHWTKPAPHPELDGVTPVVTPPQPVDKSARGDRHAAVGVTTVVAHRTQEQLDQVPRPAIDRANCLDGTPRHEFSRRSRTCVYCGLDAPAGLR